jgi:putative transposase
LYPTKEQESYLKQQIGNNRFLWNQLLEANNNHYELTKKFLWYYDLNGEIDKLKTTHEFLKFSNSQSLQQTAMHLDAALKEIKKGKGYPRFKKKTLGGSFQIPQHFQFNKNYIFIPKVAKKLKDRWVHFKKHRKFEGLLKSVTVSLDVDRWYISVLTEIEKEIPVDTRPAIGIDLGLTNFLTTDDSSEVANPRYLKKTLKKLAREQRKLSRRQKDSSNRYKQRKVVAKINQKVREQRKDFLHQVSARLIAKTSTFCVEDLCIKGLVKTRMSKSVSDVGWSQFLSLLTYKASWSGSSVIKVDRFYPSSQLCSCCGNQQKLTLDQRIYNCPRCGLVLGRDVNAAINIRNEGIRLLGTVGATGTSGQPVNACGESRLSTRSMKQEKDIANCS